MSDTSNPSAAINFTEVIVRTLNSTLTPNDDDESGVKHETRFEYRTDFLLGIAFLITTIIATRRMRASQTQTNAENTVVSAFYTLILLTASFRSAWFLIPNSFLRPSYLPAGVMAFDDDNPSWFGAFVSVVLLSVGSICLFSIFILILVYWADILKKYFYPGARRSKPMKTFITIVFVLGMIELVNYTLFLGRHYSTEAMTLVDAVVLAIVSLVCVVEISIFSHRFRTVLKTLGAINQISTESQVKRIVWITVTGNVFFVTRACLETSYSVMLIYFYIEHGTVHLNYSHSFWDVYVCLMYGSEFAILCLMLYILKNKFATNDSMANTSSNGVGGDQDNRGTYDAIPDDVGSTEEESAVIV